MKNSDGREKKMLECPKTKKIIGKSRICNCHDFDMVFSCYDLTNFFALMGKPVFYVVVLNGYD